jgi:hypothetical protein
MQRQRSKPQSAKCNLLDIDNISREKYLGVKACGEARLRHCMRPESAAMSKKRGGAGRNARAKK